MLADAMLLVVRREEKTVTVDSVTDKEGNLISLAIHDASKFLPASWVGPAQHQRPSRGSTVQQFNGNKGEAQGADSKAQSATQCRCAAFNSSRFLPA